MKKIFFLFLLSLIFVPKVFAQYGEEVLGIEAELNVDKKIVLKDKSLVDNLGISDEHYSPTEEVVYKIRVINNTNKDLENVFVSDTLPSYLTYVKSPGKYDKKTRTLTFTISKIKKNEIKEYNVKVKVYKTEELPQDLGVYCLINKATVKNGDYYDEDTAQICIEKPSLPPTGPKDTAIILFGSLALILSGVFISKKSQLF